VSRDKTETRILSWRLWLTGLWLVVTLSISGWWMVHGLRQAEMLANTALSDEAAKQQRMLFWEGAFLLSFVTIGGVALSYFVYRDQRRFEDGQRFFSTFTHELKTSLTSLRLQAEILEEDPKNRENQNLRRLLRDVVRLELQLENALILAQAEKENLFLEEVALRKTLQSLSMHWPQLEVKVTADARLQGDQRAVECILRNLLQNSYVHGEAGRVEVEARSCGDQVEILVRDNGKGFPEPEKLGARFVRHTTRSGSGLGLYLSRLLANRMGGSLDFAAASPGLEARLKLGGRIS
jgi:signal transduction histidine kinase